MRQALIGMAAVFASFAAMPAAAAIFTYVVSGTVVADTSDGGVAFGEAVVGQTFSARFEVDDAQPLALYAAGAAGSSAQGGGLVQDGTRPPVTAVLTINGIDRRIRTGDKDEPPLCIPGAGCFGAYARIDDLGSIAKDAGARRLDLATRYEDVSGCCADYGSWYSSDTDDLRFSLNADGLTAPDYRQGGRFAVAGTGSFLTEYDRGDRSSGAYSLTSLTLAPTLLQVSGPVPEPATWMTMLLGFALVGAACRRTVRLRTA